MTLDHDTSTVVLRIQGAERILIVYSVSSCSLLQSGVAEVPLGSTTFETFGVTGDSLDILEEKEVLFQMGCHLQLFIFGLQIANICGWYYWTEFFDIATG